MCKTQLNQVTIQSEDNHELLKTTQDEFIIMLKRDKINVNNQNKTKMFCVEHLTLN